MRSSTSLRIMTINKIVVGGLGNNCYVIESEKMGIIIDPGDEADKIIRAARGLAIKIILATHRHFDHISALEPVKQVVKAEAAIHPLDWVSGFESNESVFICVPIFFEPFASLWQKSPIFLRWRAGRWRFPEKSSPPPWPRCR